MGWLGSWIGAWGGRWLGYEPEQQPESAPYTRYGRVLNPLTDRLFGFSEGSWQCSISSGAVILGRTDTDDYVRFRVPDTNCPPLPEPNSPLDSGVADEAEPNRWQYGGQYVSGPGWRFGATAGQALDWVQPAYTCYDGDFETQISLSWSDAGLPRGSGARSTDFDLFVFGIPPINSGIVLGWFGGESANQPWDLGVYAYVNGSVGTQLGWLRAGSTGVFKLRRVGSTISVQYGSNSATVATGVSGQVQLKLWRDYTLPSETATHIPAVTVMQWSTNSGAPTSITVTSPVVDVGQPSKVTPTGYPAGVSLEWRASNTPFNAGDPAPSWSNPTGSFRYWQARLQTSSSNVLLERIEFLPDAFPLLVWRRFRSYWQLLETGAGRATKGPFRTVFGSGNQKRTGENEWTQDSDEERNIGDGWL
jgi:hypothetical protein